MNPITPTVAGVLQMNKKSNILQYKANSSNLTKKQQYSLIAQSKWKNRTKTWATQSMKYTNPNTTNLPKVGNSLICSSPAVICVPTSSSDVPGPIIDICYDDSLPTYYPRENTIMNTSTNGFPKNLKGLTSASNINYVWNNYSPENAPTPRTPALSVIQGHIEKLNDDNRILINRATILDVSLNLLLDRTRHQSATATETAFASSLTNTGDVTLGSNYSTKIILDPNSVVINGNTYG
jgi:hypothetical protein